MGVRKIKIEGEQVGMVDDNLLEIDSSQILKINKVEDFPDLTKEKIFYKSDFKDIDNKETQKYLDMEEIDPTLTENEDESSDEIDDENLNIVIESNSLTPENTLDEEGFDFEELDDGIILEVVQELEEIKILFTEDEQEEDIIQELIRMLPKKKIKDKIELKKIINQVRLFKYLKSKYSKSNEIQNDN